MSVFVGIDPASSGSDEHQVAVSKSVGGWKVVARGSARANQVILSVPSEMLTLRSMTVPFSDRKRAEDVVRQELANTLPMRMDEVVWSVCAIGRHEYLAVVSPINRLQPLRENCDPPPDVIDAEPFSYARALAAANVREALVVDGTDNRTTFCVIQNGRPFYVRVMLRGTPGPDGLDRAGYRDYVDHLVSDAVLPELAPDLKVYVAGPACTSPDFMERLGERMERQVLPFPMPEGLSAALDVSALGAALRSVYPEDGVDLQQQKATGRPVWIPWIAWSFIVLTLLLGDVMMRQYLALRQHQANVAALTAVIQKEAPTLKDPTVDALRARVTELRKQQSGAGPNVLEILRTLADKAKGKNLHLFEINMADQKIKVRGEAPSYKESTAYKTELRTSFPEVEDEDSHTTPQNRVNFTMRVGLEARP